MNEAGIAYQISLAKKFCEIALLASTNICIYVFRVG